jgi:hypothetical protein
MIYCCMQIAVTRLWHSKQLIRLIMIAHETKEDVKPAVTSRNNMRATVFSALLNCRVCELETAI